MHKMLLPILLLWLLLPLYAFCASPAGSDKGINRGIEQSFDIVTMKNGDIHQGTVATEFLSIETSLGKISIPYHRLHSLTTQNHKQSDSITTRPGEILYGKIIETEITMLRVLDSTLPLSINDIATINFASRGISSPLDPTPDVIKTQMGDQLMVRIITKDFLLKTNSIQLFSSQNIRFIDSFSTEENDKPLIQITLKDGNIHQGHLSTENIQIETANAQTLNIPIEIVSSIHFQADSKNGKVDFKHRWGNKPASLFQDHMIDDSLAPEMVIIQGKTYVRGDAQGDTDEQPPTPVTPGKFAISVFEITFEDYDKFCTDTRRRKPDDQGWGRQQHPVVNVSWEDAKAYTEWLSKKTRKNYRLPTDAEWEFAARAGTKTKYWWGKEIGMAQANCEGCQSLWDGAQTAPVGSFPANPFGLHDTAGNVFEWVADCYHDSFADAPADGTAMEKPDCGKRVIRGGAWSFPPKEIRSANRWRDFPTRRSDDTGFRIARDI
jgi:formylglycine-generating enzyme required for sulfatase activity